MSRFALIMVTAFMLFMGGFGAILAGQPITRAVTLGRQTVLESPESPTQQATKVLSVDGKSAILQHTTAISVTLLLPAEDGQAITITVPLDLDLDIAVAGGKAGILRLLQQEIPVVDVADLMEEPAVLTTLPSLLPVPTPDPINGPPHVDVVANLRRGPNVDFPIAGQVRPGDTFSILARNPDGAWYQVQTADGTTGWMAAFLAKGRVEEGELDVIPGVFALVPTPIPTPTPAPADDEG